MGANRGESPDGGAGVHDGGKALAVGESVLILPCRCCDAAEATDAARLSCRKYF